MKGDLDKELIRLNILEATGVRVKVRYAYLHPSGGALIAVIKHNDGQFIVEGKKVNNRQQGYDLLTLQAKEYLKK